VTRQTQEIGIRMALGATAGRVQASIIAKTLRLALLRYCDWNGGVICGSPGDCLTSVRNRAYARRKAFSGERQDMEGAKPSP
jgi:hypothetical protein